MMTMRYGCRGLLLLLLLTYIAVYGENYEKAQKEMFALKCLLPVR